MSYLEELLPEFRNGAKISLCNRTFHALGLFYVLRLGVMV